MRIYVVDEVPVLIGKSKSQFKPAVWKSRLVSDPDRQSVEKEEAEGKGGKAAACVEGVWQTSRPCSAFPTVLLGEVGRSVSWQTRPHTGCKALLAVGNGWPGGRDALRIDLL